MAQAPTAVFIIPGSTSTPLSFLATNGPESRIYYGLKRVLQHRMVIPDGGATDEAEPARVEP